MAKKKKPTPVVSLEELAQQLADLWMVMAALIGWNPKWHWRGDDWPGTICGLSVPPVGKSDSSALKKNVAASLGIPWPPPPPATICRVPPSEACLGPAPGWVCGMPEVPIAPPAKTKKTAKAKKTAKPKQAAKPKPGVKR